jgi:4-amino-4-deoxy-L-arabinose transferase-like glycosyltransferase
MGEVAFGLMRLLLLPASWLGCYALCRKLAAQRRIDADRRVAIVLASVLWGALLALITELCSLGHALNATSLTLIWLFITVVLFWWARPLPSADGAAADPAQEPPEALPPPPNEETRTLLAGTVLILGLLAVVALTTPSTGWDSLTYHLPRVMHWIQNESVAHFATSNTREIESAPWPGFAVTHTLLLYGNDRFANLVQWLALVFLAVTATLAARQLAGLIRRREADAAEGAPVARRDENRRLAAVTALRVVTVPAGALQAVTTYTDLVVSGWLLGAITLGLALIRDPGNRVYAWGVGGAVALGLLSKVTMFFYALPFLAWLAVVLLIRSNARRRLPSLALALIVSSLALNLPHWARNYAVFGSPLGSDYMFRLQRNAHLSWNVTASNAIRNGVLHTATGIEPLTRAINQGLLFLHSLTGRDLEDPETTFGSVKFYPAAGFPIADNQTGNPYHLALILAALGTLLVKRRPGRWKLLWYIAAVAAGFLAFCVYLRWQPWHTRLHLPWFFVLLPAAAVVVVPLWSRWLVRTLMAGLFALALACVLFNRSRPLLPGDFLFQSREQQYFLEAAQGYPLVAQLADDIQASGAQRIGLVLRHDFRESMDDREYPYWLLPRNRGFRGRVEHVHVTNETRLLMPRAGLADVIVSTLDVPPDGLTATHPHKVEYSQNLVLHETEEASYWCRLTTLSLRGETPREIPHEQQSVSMSSGRFNFTARAGRPGVLHLTGWPREIHGQPLRNTQLYVKSFAGCVVLQPNEGSPFAVELPLPAGSTAVTLALLGDDNTALTNIELRGLQWAWRAENRPLPWARITQVTDPSAAEPAPPGTTFFRVSADETKLLLTAGMDGTVELWLEVALESPVQPTYPVTLLMSVAEGTTERYPIQAGLNRTSIPVQAGPNIVSLRCETDRTVSDAAKARLVVRTAELRFAGSIDLQGLDAHRKP